MCDEKEKNLMKELNKAESAKDWECVERVWKKIFDYHLECYLKGDGGAALSLATAYFSGHGVCKNLLKSWEMFNEAERLGCKTAAIVRLSYFRGDDSPERLIEEERLRKELEFRKPEWMRRKKL